MNTDCYTCLDIYLKNVSLYNDELEAYEKSNCNPVSKRIETHKRNYDTNLNKCNHLLDTGTINNEQYNFKVLQLRSHNDRLISYYDKLHEDNKDKKISELRIK